MDGGGTRRGRSRRQARLPFRGHRAACVVRGDRSRARGGDRGRALVPRSSFVYSVRSAAVAPRSGRCAARDHREGPGPHRAARRHRGRSRRSPHPARRGCSRFRAGGRAVKRILLSLGAALGIFAWWLGVRRAVALDGLARAFPQKSAAERRALARAAYAQLGRSLAEILLPAPEVRFEGWEVYEKARAEGRGVVCAVAHYGNFELLARAVGRRGVALGIIVRRLHGPFNRWLLSARLVSGVRHLSDRGSSAEAIALLRGGGVLAIAGDQNMRPSRGGFFAFFV